jgi:Leucine-rich repeat (LRR) protein
VNKLSGPVPPELTRCDSLTDLELDNNQLTRSIPAALGGLPSLRVLYLWANQLTGTIPLKLGRCASLEELDLSSNALTGSIPRSLFWLPWLSKLLLINNDLSGELPPEVGNCTSLVRFRVSGNHIAGSVPAEIDRLGNLSFLDLGSNRLFGSVPAEILGCRNLTFVDLHDNAVAGELPRGTFRDLLSLQYLDLSKNIISGALLLDVGMLTSLTKLILSGNRLSGTVPLKIRSCSRLQLLDLDGNSFSGKIPGSIGKIPGLEIAVNLSCGTILSEFGWLVRLGVLDVSRNQLSGDLQPLFALQNLVVLNISFNGFTGRLPETAFFAKLPTSDVEGNPALCLSRCAGAADDAGDHSCAARVTVDDASIRPCHPRGGRRAHPLSSAPTRRRRDGGQGRREDVAAVERDDAPEVGDRRGGRVPQPDAGEHHRAWLVQRGVPRDPVLIRRHHHRDQDVPVLRRGLRGGVRVRGERAPARAPPQHRPAAGVGSQPSDLPPLLQLPPQRHAGRPVGSLPRC